MVDDVSQAARPVATLRFCSTRPGTSKRWMPIHPREEYNVGRKDIKEFLGIEPSTISQHHLQLRCIKYEEVDEHDILPMVYFRVLSFNSVKLKQSVAGHNTSVAVSRGHGDILLGDGDVLQLTPEIFLTFAYDRSVRARDVLQDVQRAEATCFSKQFLLTGRRLGIGGQASVYVAVKRSNGRQYACKAIRLPQARGRDGNLRSRNTAQEKAKLLEARATLAREYDILVKLDHPNIVSLDKVICASRNVYIFQELITGGDLWTYLDQQGVLSEPEAASITFQLLKAIEYLHSNGYVHRDIKPENVLLASWRGGARVVLTDFGQARAATEASSSRDHAKAFRMQSIVGTYGYTAPEIYHGVRESLSFEGYSKAVDIWSIGCVTAVLLTGEALFCQREEDVVDPPSESECRELWDVNVIEDRPSWDAISRKAKSFVRRCLDHDEEQRMTAQEALSHAWFTNKHYASDLAAAYERAIADWQPRTQHGDRVEFIDTTAATHNVSKRPLADGNVAQTMSKHFKMPQKVFALPTSVAPKINMHAHPFRPLQAPVLQPAMSRDPKHAERSVGATAHYDDDQIPSASPFNGDESVSGSIHPAGSTGPLSIWQYAPPDTQYTRPGLQGGAATQLSDTQTQLPRPPQTSSFLHDSTRAVGTQPTQMLVQLDRLRKEACR